MPRRRQLVVLVAIIAALGVGGYLFTSYRTPSGDLGLVGAWSADGRGVGISGVSAARGAEHCEWESAIFLELDGVDRRRFVRDPEGALGPHTDQAAFASGVQPPPAAVDTGFTRTGNGLAVDPTGAAYVTRPNGAVERWPELARTVGCD